MNILRKSFSVFSTTCSSNGASKLIASLSRNYCETSSKGLFEKSINQVVLMGRVGVNPQLRGTEERPVVIFTLATNINYRYDSGDYTQKTDWHRVTVFRPYLRDIVLQHLKKGMRVYIEGRILYGEFSDTKGNAHQTTSIVANDVIFIGGVSKKDQEPELIEEKGPIEGRDLL